MQKNDDGVLLWTVKREDSIKGTTAILTAWDANGEIRFQCDTTRDEFSEMNPDTVYNDLSQNQYESIGISQAFAYCGGSVYRIRSDLYYVFMNIDTGKFFSVTGTQCISGAGGRKPDDSNTTGTESA